MDTTTDISANPFSVKTPETLKAEELITLFVPYPEYENLQLSGHQFLNGHRGSGKSMMLRMMAPDCQILSRNCSLNKLPFFGVYLSIKTTELNSPEYERLEAETSGFVLSEHVLVTKTLSALAVSLRKYCSNPAKKSLHNKEFDLFLSDIYRVLENAGWESKSKFEPLAIGETSEALFDHIVELVDEIQITTSNYIKRRSFAREYVAYQGALLGFQDTLLPVVDILRRYKLIPMSPVYLLLDDADNLTLQQTKILNTWVSYRSTDRISLKISTQLNYKTKKTSSNSLIESPHDFSEINFTSVLTGSIKEGYPNLISQIVSRRLERYGLKNYDPKSFFPEDEKQADEIAKIADEIRLKWKAGESGAYRAEDDVYRYARPEYIRRQSGSSKQGARYKYAGFDQLIHISSGIIRFFLEPAARMFTEQHRANNGEMVTYISPSIQDKEIRNQADEVYLKSFKELENEPAEINGASEHLKDIERLRNLISGIGSLFRAHIMDEALSQRRIFSFMISDRVPEDLKKLLQMGVSYGYLYEGSIGNKSGMGRTVLYVLTRRLAPCFQLDPIGFSASLSVTSTFLLEISENPSRFVNRLKKDGVKSVLSEQKQLSLLDGDFSNEKNSVK